MTVQKCLTTRVPGTAVRIVTMLVMCVFLISFNFTTVDTHAVIRRDTYMEPSQYVYIYNYSEINNRMWHKDQIEVNETTANMNRHNYIVDSFYENRKLWRLSKLGNILYKNEGYPKIDEYKKYKHFVILIWEHWQSLQPRHVYYFGNDSHDPFTECSVKNCYFTGDNENLKSADAVVVHIQRGKIPTLKNRNPKQRWIFLNDESPNHAFHLSRTPVYLSSLYNVFNWSMTYKSTSDIPVPYGRTVGLKAPIFSLDDPPITELIPHWNNKRRDILVALLMSHCTVKQRNRILIEFSSYIQIDVHGKCGEGELKKSCPGHFRKDCEEISQYLFYLVLENAACDEYMSEKLFQNAYSKGAIPIIWSPSVETCDLLLPPQSYLHVDKYLTLKDLADDIVRLSEDEYELLTYHEWRNHFEVLNEHGYFGTKSVHLCRMCEALNYNDDVESVYGEQKIKEFLDPSQNCKKNKKL